MLSAKFYTVKDIADLLSVGDITVRNWIKSEALRAIKLEREYRVARVDLESFLNAHATTLNKHRKKSE